MTGLLTPLRAPFERFGDVESQGLGEWWVHVERGVWRGGPWAGKWSDLGMMVTSERRDLRRRRR